MSASLAQPLPRAGLLLAGLALALALRLVVAGPALGSSVPAGLAFAAALLAAVFAAGWRPAAPRLPAVLIGVAGAGVLVLFPALRDLTGAPPLANPASAFPLWAAVVALVALAEEVLLRGVLFSLLERAGGPFLAVGISSVAFALLHVPLYGLGALPLDLAVGVWLGGLRLLAGSVTAPAVAHVLADLAAWWAL